MRDPEMDAWCGIEFPVYEEDYDEQFEEEDEEMLVRSKGRVVRFGRSRSRTFLKRFKKISNSRS